MKSRIISLAAVLSVTVGAAFAQAPAPAPVAKPAAQTCTKQKLSSESLIAEILDNADAKAVLIKHVPVIKDDDQIEMARPMSLRSIQSYAEDLFTDKVLEAIDADLAKLPLCPKA